MPENEITVSVIVSARNDQKYLPHCLQALQSQTLRDMEVIVVDCGSGDRTHEIALEFQRERPDVFRVHRQNSADIFCAQKAGLALARGKYAAFCGADEVAGPGMYEALFYTCEVNGTGIAGGNIWARALRGMLVRRAYLLEHGLPVKTGFARDEQLAAYDTLRQLISPDELPLFCADWMETLRGICLREYRDSRAGRGGAAFYRRMISLAGEPQVAQAVALADRGALDRAHRRFYDAFVSRKWIRLEKKMRAAGVVAEGVGR